MGYVKKEADMEKEITLNIAGMSCAACSASVEKVTIKLEGVKLCEVNLATNQAHIIYETEQVKLSDIKLKIQKAGFEPRELAEISREELRDEEMEEHRYRVWFQREYFVYSQIDTVYYSLLALERHLLEKKGLILHCAMLRVGGEALLFSGPSGIGKSTHAQLWCIHATDAQVINGDRALLQYGSDRLFAHGWCVSGSSEICINRSLPVRAIIFLRQEQKNDGVQLHGLQAVKKMISQITVNSWNPQAVERVWELTEQIAGDVPVFDYGCNMEPEAVYVLKQLLGMNNANISGTEPDESMSR